MKEPQTLSADVIVVGGGMVGSLTAAALASCGLDVIVLELSLIHISEPTRPY